MTVGGLIRQATSHVNLPDLASRVMADSANIVRLSVGLARDPRVPVRNKLIFAGVAGYFLLPNDIVPDWLPGLGRLDDVIMLCVGLDAMLNHVPESVLSEYWQGDPALLNAIRSGVQTATEFVPDKLMRALYPGEIAR